MELFTLQNLTFTYPGGAAPALRDISLSVKAGEFILLCGPSGSGKSTLLRQLKTCLAPQGKRSGAVLFEGTPLEQVDAKAQAGGIGFVLQSPDSQAVTHKVWHELAFGLESLGLPQATVRRRVAEIAAFFGIEHWFYKDISQLSGGQKQLLNLASVMAMQPKVLLLDEPTAQLDPIAAADFMALLGRIHRELGTAVILSEHQLEDAFAYAGRVWVMEAGRIAADGQPRQVALALKQRKSPMFAAMPAAMRIWAGVDTALSCPVTVPQGREFLENREREQPLSPLPVQHIPPAGETVLEGKGLWFRYDKDSPDVLRQLDIRLGKGELLALMGGNGTGKTTALRLLAGLEKPYRGKVRVHGKLALLPQNPKALFIKDTLGQDLAAVCPADSPVFAKTVSLCGLSSLLGRHPYDLSGGEQQRSALAKVLLTQPDILLLDEPTKGFDPGFRRSFGAILQQLCAQGVSILLVSHDTHFCASYAHRCALFFDGCLVAQAAPREFFSGSSFYTTAANRIARSIEPQAVTVEDVIALCGGEIAQPPLPEEELPPPPAKAPQEAKKLPLWRRCLAWAFGLGALALAAYCLANASAAGLFSGGYLNARGWQRLGCYGALLLCLAGLYACLGRPKKKAAPQRPSSPWAKAASLFCLLAAPVTLYIGIGPLGGKHYNLIALALLVECMAPFALLFEGRKPQPRELVTLAVLCGLGVAGRSAFAWLPQFKPVLALTVVAGAGLGAQQGFLVGALTMLCSNMLFSQGPWTPWQMFAMGLCGFLSGLVFRRRSPGGPVLSLFGGLAAVGVYGVIMNFSSAVTWHAQALSWPIVAGYMVTGLPMDLIHGLATAFFLALMGSAMLKKLERLQEKYPAEQQRPA